MPVLSRFNMERDRSDHRNTESYRQQRFVTEGSLEGFSSIVCGLLDTENSACYNMTEIINERDRGSKGAYSAESGYFYRI